MRGRLSDLRRLLVLFAFGTFGFVVFYNSLLLDRRDAPLPGEWGHA